MVLLYYFPTITKSYWMPCSGMFHYTNLFQVQIDKSIPYYRTDIIRKKGNKGNINVTNNRN